MTGAFRRWLWGWVLAAMLVTVPPVGAAGHTYLPVVGRSVGSPACPPASSARFDPIPVAGPPSDRPAAQHADLNLALRGYLPTAADLAWVDYGGGADPAAPQLRSLFGDGRMPALVAAYGVHDWDWSCGAAGCRGPVLTSPPVTLLGMATTPGEPIRIPSRGPEIYGGGYRALVLFAEDRRITLKYTREDNVVAGYTVHLENVCVDHNLLELYSTVDSQGRHTLPGLRNGQALGVAAGDAIAVAVRDGGNFMDPRSRKDWWQTSR